MAAIDIKPEINKGQVNKPIKEVGVHLTEPIGELTIISPRHRIDQRIHDILTTRAKQGFLSQPLADERVYLRSLARRQQRAIMNGTFKEILKGGV